MRLDELIAIKRSNNPCSHAPIQTNAMYLLLTATTYGPPASYVELVSNLEGSLTPLGIRDADSYEYHDATEVDGLDDHPETFVLTDAGGFAYGPKVVPDAFVVGVAIQNQEIWVHDDAPAQFPMAVIVNKETRVIDELLRDDPGTLADDAVEIRCVLTFAQSISGVITDVELGSTLKVNRGITLDCPLLGKRILKVPNLSSFGWAGNDFFPDAGLWGDRKR